MAGGASEEPNDRIDEVKQLLASGGLETTGALPHVQKQLANIIRLCQELQPQRLPDGAGGLLPPTTPRWTLDSTAVDQEVVKRVVTRVEELRVKLRAKDALAVISRRPDLDLQTAAQVLVELEELEVDGMSAAHVDRIFGLLTILDPASEAMAMKIQARARGLLLRKTQEEVGGDLKEAHRKQEQYLILEEQIANFEANKKKLIRQNKAVFSHPVFLHLKTM